MGLAIVSILMSSQSVDMNAIVADQTGTWMGFVPRWNVLRQPLAFVVFLVAAFAESNRLPLTCLSAVNFGGYTGTR